jgi:hypothetical protein
MAVDAGAQQIHDLLNQEAPVLNEELAKIARAAKSAHKNPYGVMSQSGVDAVAEVRQFYRGLRNEIASIETVDTGSRTSALQSLDALDASFGAYERGLELGMSRPAVPKLRNAVKKARQAKTRMSGTIAGLSR